MLVLIWILLVCLEISDNMSGGFEKFVHPKGVGLWAERHQAAGHAVTGHRCHQLIVTLLSPRGQRGARDPWASWIESCRDAVFRVDTLVPREEWVRSGGEPWPVKRLCLQRTSVLVSSLSCLCGFPSEAWDRGQRDSILVFFPLTLRHHTGTQSHSSEIQVMLWEVRGVLCG